MKEEPGLPKTIVNQISEYSSSFILMYFDEAGNPAYIQNFPQIKDRMAMMQLLTEYLNTDGLPFETDDEDDPPDNPANNEGEGWKKT